MVQPMLVRTASGAFGVPLKTVRAMMTSKLSCSRICPIWLLRSCGGLMLFRWGNYLLTDGVEKSGINVDEVEKRQDKGVVGGETFSDVTERVKFHWNYNCFRWFGFVKPSMSSFTSGAVILHCILLATFQSRKLHVLLNGGKLVRCFHFLISLVSSKNVISVGGGLLDDDELLTNWVFSRGFLLLAKVFVVDVKIPLSCDGSLCCRGVCSILSS